MKKRKGGKTVFSPLAYFPAYYNSMKTILHKSDYAPRLGNVK